jgi:septation ring formation regulator EzrA
MLYKPNHVPRIINRQDLFNKLLHSTDFTKSKNSLDAVKIMFEAMFPSIQRVVEDNESLLIEQEKVLKNFAELDEKYKKLEEEYAALREQIQNESHAKVEGN